MQEDVEALDGTNIILPSLKPDPHRGPNPSPFFQTKTMPRVNALAANPLSVDIWFSCSKCKTLTYIKQFEQNLRVCPACNYHGRLRWFERILYLLDLGSFFEQDLWLEAGDRLNFQTSTDTYINKIRDTQYRTSMGDALVTGTATLKGQPLAVAVADFAFMGASMGSVFGEKFVRLVETAIEKNLPLLTISSSGGARMHEGLFSLMQMSKTTAALARLGKARLPHIALLADPCYGGVTASYPMVADVILAEPGAMVGFAGPRVIQQTIRENLPEGFQTAEFLLEHGMIDAVVERKNLPDVLSKLLGILGQGAGQSLGEGAEGNQPETAPEENTGAAVMSGEIRETATKDGYTVKGEVEAGGLSQGQLSAQDMAWERVKLARHPKRLHTQEYFQGLFSHFFELRGDRRFSDDAAIIGGLALFEGRPVVAIGHQKGTDTKENLYRNFGMPRPEGYRKALRLFRLAEKLGLPVLTFIDTPGAFPGLESEERSVAQAIAENLLVMAELATPFIAVIIGEGGSGGALAIGQADRVIMLENSIYSVASPEAAASILWRSSSLAPEAAVSLKITAPELLELGLVDAVVPEPPGGNHTDRSGMLEALKEKLLEDLAELDGIFKDGPVGPAKLVEQRYRKYRSIGTWQEAFLPI
ncbi:MAG: acetyl-CoA carboxylase carboxyltransferase subunit alpha [Chloroflexi bacterium]|nr:acetyl-CoA carboxylase carboxyltransferase subunit alpha [Chloroflexota bacterium]